MGLKNRARKKFNQKCKTSIRYLAIKKQFYTPTTGGFTSKNHKIGPRAGGVQSESPCARFALVFNFAPKARSKKFESLTFKICIKI